VKTIDRSYPRRLHAMSDPRPHRPGFVLTLGVLAVMIAAALWAKGFFQAGYVVKSTRGATSR